MQRPNAHPGLHVFIGYMALHAVSEVNPYLLPAVMLACGFWGIDTKANPHMCSFPADVNMYDRTSETFGNQQIKPPVLPVFRDSIMSCDDPESTPQVCKISVVQHGF